MTSTPLSPQLQAEISSAADLLRAGEVVAFPTETVYGLGADVTHAAAIKKIFQIKQRPINHPLIVHIGDVAQLSQWAEDIPDLAWELAEQFWPGPLTLILKRSPLISDLVTGGQNTVGIRIPAHPVAQGLLQALGPEKALVAPSANRFGRISPTTAAHVCQELGQQIAMILDGGACEVGLESTIISFEQHRVKILRPGGISVAALTSVLDQPVVLAHNKQSAIRVSGDLPMHYAPVTPLKVCSTEEIWDAARELSTRQLRSVIICWSASHLNSAHDTLIQHYNMPSNPIDYGRQLYATLREYDNGQVDQILIEAIPDHPSWLAIADRLKRATHNE